MSDQMEPSMAMIDDHLFIGNAAASRDAATLRENGITAIISLQDSEVMVRHDPGNEAVVSKERHLALPCQDASTMDLVPLFPKACEFIDAQIPHSPSYEESISALLGQSTSASHAGSSQRQAAAPGRVLIHCSQGLSRAPTVAIAYLMRKRREAPHAITAEVKNKRDISPRGSFLEQLQIWGSLNYEPWLDSDGETPKPEYQEFLDRLDLKRQRKRPVSDEISEPVDI